MKRSYNSETAELETGKWRFGGFLGGRIDTLSEARLSSDFARNEIHGELIEAFRKRIDDRREENYGYWQGEFWGKWILSAVAACRYYDDESLKDFIRGSVDDLLATQDPDGYIGTYHNPDFVRSRNGNHNWNVWCRKYTLWGLLECWKLLGDDSILEAAVRFADNLLSLVGPGKIDIIRTGKMYGMPSTSILTPIVMLHEATGEERYLKYAAYMVDRWSEHPDGPPDILNKGLTGAPVHTWFPDAQDWAKSYEFISCTEGLLHLYRITGESNYLKAAQNIHRNLRRWERSAVGSVSFNDKIVGSRRLINIVAEICDAVYWNRLSFELLSLTGESVYADEIERTLYNALLCGMKPDGTWGLRRLRFSHEHVPSPHHCGLQHHHCCLDNLPRGFFQASQVALMGDEDGFRCLLYNPGKGTIELPSGQNVEIRIDGNYPETGDANLSLNLVEPEEFALKLRIPQWAEEIELSVNSDPIEAPRSRGWLVVERTWENGDTVEIHLDMILRCEYFDPSHLDPDDPLVGWSAQQWARIRDTRPEAPEHTLTVEDALPHRKAVAFLRGPVVLARDRRLGEQTLFAPMPEDFDPGGGLSAQPAEPPAEIWQTFEIKGRGTGFSVCDFASAGNTWDPTSRFNAWWLPG